VVTCTVAVDAMGGDNAPREIVAGALRASEELGARVLLVGREEDIVTELPGGRAPDGIDVVDAREVIAMGDDPIGSVRRQKDSSLVRCAEAVRDGKADAMISAGNTGAATAAAVLRLGRFKGVPSPAITVPIPVPGSHPQLMVDAGAVVDPAPERLVQHALMASAYAGARYSIEQPRIGLLSNGEEPGKGDALRKAAFPMLQALPGFVGNVEGRDFMRSDRVDVIVTDGFTGNIALKCLEGALKSLASLVFEVLDATPEAREAGKVLLPALLDAAELYDPEVTGGAVLMGIKGLCIISHGSSSAKAIVAAVRVADDSVRLGMVERMREAVTDAG
jgi:glycerol-3-phosphate acyltransferase PlsX